MNQSIKNVINFPITKIILGIVSCLAIILVVQNTLTKPIFYRLIYSKEISDVIKFVRDKFKVVLITADDNVRINRVKNRNNFSEIKDHALWTSIECKNNKEIKQQIINAKTEEELIQIVKGLKF
jgi:dephospho-CoA kinase